MKRDLRNMEELKKLLKNPPPKLKVPVYTEEDKVGFINSKDNTMKKITLSQRMSRLEASISELTILIKDGFKQVNTRLDYIVKANNLKDLPKTK